MDTSGSANHRFAATGSVIAVIGAEGAQRMLDHIKIVPFIVSYNQSPLRNPSLRWRGRKDGSCYVL